MLNIYLPPLCLCSILEMWRLRRDWWHLAACALTRPLDLIFSMNGDMPHVPITTLAGIASLTDCKCNIVPLKLFTQPKHLTFITRRGETVGFLTGNLAKTDRRAIIKDAKCYWSSSLLMTSVLSEVKRHMLLKINVETQRESGSDVTKKQQKY